MDTTAYAKKLHEDLVSILRADPEVQVLSTTLDSPFPDVPNETGSADDSHRVP